MSDAPRMMFTTELQESMAYGADLMAAMIRASVFGNGELPPQEMFDWYVMNTTYRFISEEFALRHKLEGASADAVTATQEELNAIKKVLGKTKQFALQAKIDDALRIREMHL